MVILFLQKNSNEFTMFHIIRSHPAQKAVEDYLLTESI